MIFIDASAMVAILAEEPGAAHLIRRLDEAKSPITSPVAVFETATALSRKLSQSHSTSQSQVERFLETAGIRVVPIMPGDGERALAAHARFGKGRHPARLNLGDCFAYACAKAHGARLLFVGDDFPQTDIAPAL